MKNIAVVSLFSIIMAPLQAQLPSMCFDGTYAGGDECQILIDGKKVGVGLEPDEFFQDEEEITEELGEKFKHLHDKIHK